MNDSNCCSRQYLLSCNTFGVFCFRTEWSIWFYARRAFAVFFSNFLQRIALVLFIANSHQNCIFFCLLLPSTWDELSPFSSRNAFEPLFKNLILKSKRECAAILIATQQTNHHSYWSLHKSSNCYAWKKNERKFINLFLLAWALVYYEDNDDNDDHKMFNRQMTEMNDATWYAFGSLFWESERAKKRKKEE